VTAVARTQWRRQDHGGEAAPSVSRRQMRERCGVQGRIRGGRPRAEQIGAMMQVGKVPETLRVREHVDLFPQLLFRRHSRSPTSSRSLVSPRLPTENSASSQAANANTCLFALAICGDPALAAARRTDRRVRRRDAVAPSGERIATFARSGKSILLTTHYLEEAGRTR